ncbi:hypothetical protein [Acidisphaera sp. S103]|uniref:hypothetical protein n=1 Tax=Acidisphaera sp. S103 TaxID=1747223 RepID=UPI00131B0A5A|nr:hypothetical protein [Acidisphaera sp. S103]
MTVQCDLTISFASAGNSLAFLGGGWAQSEDDFTWGIGAESHLVFPRLGAADEFVLTLDVVPFVHAPELPGQRLIVSVNDTVVGSTDISRPTLLGYRIPASLARRSDKMVVTLQHPDAARPRDFSDIADDRPLAFALFEAKLYRVTDSILPRQTRLPTGLMLGSTQERGFGARGHVDLTEWATTRTGLAIPQIALKFESLGENCEFGLFQRRCDAEPLGLLRFSSTFMRNLIRGIDNGFAGLGEIDDIEPRLEGAPRKEYMIHEKKFGLVYHTFVYEGQRSIWLMREQESARLKFLRRKFLEDLELTDKIFIYKFGSGVSEEEILPLHMALNRHGEATLLWVVPAERDRPAGTVEVVMPGLLKGYIDRFAPDDNAHDFSFEGWLRVCANACVMARLQRLPAEPVDPNPGAGQEDDPSRETEAQGAK